MRAGAYCTAVASELEWSMEVDNGDGPSAAEPVGYATMFVGSVVAAIAAVAMGVRASAI